MNSQLDLHSTNWSTGLLRFNGLLISLIFISPVFANDGLKNEEVLGRFPASVGAVGDSMTAAAFAGYKRQNSIYPWVTLGLLADALRYGVTKDLHSIEHRKYSWITGSSIPSRAMPSHLKRLSLITGKNLPYFNASLSGADSDDVLKTQLHDLGRWSQEHLNQEFPDYVSVLIGANDICADDIDGMLSTEQFFRNVQSSVHEILRRSPKSRVLISALPNVVKLRDVAKDANVFGGLKCEKIWKKAKLCSTLTTLSDPEQRLLVAHRLASFNIALREIAALEKDEFGDRVRFAKNLYEEDFTPKDLAIDCFHPNKSGQSILSESTFQSSWWADEWNEKRSVLKSQFLAKKKRECASYESQGPKGAHRPAICSEKWE